VPIAPATAAAASGRTGRLVALARGSGVVAVAMTAANALGYVLSLVASRRLGPAEFGVLASMLGLVLVAYVVALGVQTVAARRLAAARAGQRGPADLGGLAGTALVASVLTGALLVALTVPLASFLHLDSPAPLLWTALTMVPLTWTGLLQGAAQGLERFGLLSAVFGLAAVGKVGGGLVGVLVWGSATAAMACTALGTAVATLAATVVARSVLARPGRPRAGRDVGLATGSLLGVLVLTNLDLLLGRHYLPAVSAGVYGAGAVVAKVAYWLPQFVAVVALPRMADERRRARATYAALAAVAATGAALTGGVALLGSNVVAVVGGSAYAALTPQAWWFAALGSCFALAQLLAYGRLAREDHRAALAVWVAVVAEVAAVALSGHGSVLAVVRAALAVAATFVLLGTVAELVVLRRHRDVPERDVRPPAGQLPAGQGPGR
jgi:O-antigen/teichoic acid export membrane protein